jgi:hypothetical protein
MPQPGRAVRPENDLQRMQVKEHAMRSITMPEICGTRPPWARFIVRFGFASGHHPTPATIPCQVFGSRVAAERFASALMRALPCDYCPSSRFPCVWALVYALPRDAREGGHCYFAVDNGGAVAKRHEIMAGHYGAGGSR